MYSVTRFNQFLKHIVVLHLLVFLICVGLLFNSRGLFAYLVFTIRELQILRRGQERDFPNTMQFARANQRYFGGKMGQPSSFYYEFQRECDLLSSDRERASPPSTEISFVSFVVNKSTRKLSECLFLENRREKLKGNVNFN